MKEPQGKYAGVWQFDGSELEMATRWMWACLCDLSLKGKIEVLWRIIFSMKPQWIYDV